MTPKDVKKYYKSTYNFGKETGMSPTSLFNWMQKGFVPEMAQYKIENLTQGELKAGTAKPGKTKIAKEHINKLLEDWINLEDTYKKRKIVLKKKIKEWIAEYGDISKDNPNFEVLKQFIDESIDNDKK